ncbi:fumarylacetoacetate hydrolase family protein [Paramicrobacterium agarici]|uniref:fumarylacetoacetate hydrolase family protein n=1 Tax=Paramicrobacterium agarici TaxID=630514 RepID=UPI00114F8E40|nr:fumarylacetoacetate hydrolase family protein [Microbacterium agarici]TQO23760.1 2-keto-4-pentenoate hydratase/2-oxohepta-3-ene-1,7-dioic acid hydratase in catechol pathway [Microbacterium agarici]
MNHEVTAPKIIAVHLNYRSRAQQRGRIPAHPSYFFKPASSLSTSGATIERPADTELLAFEGEIALIIGSDVRRVSPDEGWAAVSGITAANDFGLYDFRAADKGSNVRSKGGDGYTPLGPDVIPADQVDPSAVRVRAWVNDELAQDDTTAGLLFPFGQLVADLSQMMTLHAGDIILTGTPAGSSVVQPGDEVVVEVDAPSAPGAPSSGRLMTRVVEGEVPFSDAGEKPKATDAQREAAWGSREAAGLTEPDAFELTADLREKLDATAVATLSAALRKRGHVDIFIEGVHASRPGTKMYGLARTLRFVPFRPDLFASHGGGYNAQKRAFDSVEPGEVLVMEARGERATGTVGDVLALRAQVRGAAGIVTDGGIRDFSEVASFDIPTFSQGAHPSVLGRRHVPWETDVTIGCGGAAVQPGDLIVGDDDGVIVIPPQLAREVIEAAYDQERKDAWTAEQVANGERIEGLFPMNGEWKERYQTWLSQQ